MLPPQKYFGETARPLRMRVLKHYNNLGNLRVDSFMVEHWMFCHGLNMLQPVFKFRRIQTFGDSMSRQLAEALLIESEGNLNKRLEQGHNHLYRLQNSKSPWEEEQHMDN